MINTLTSKTTIFFLLILISAVNPLHSQNSDHASLRSFKDCSNCPEMIALPAPPESRPFAIGKYEITQAEWYAVMKTKPSEYRGSRLPVETISWRDAQEFARRLSKKTRQTYRLPTAAEWEYAAKAASGAAYYFGDEAKDLDRHAWYLTNAEEKTHPVGQKIPNAFGLYDIHGNVWEWTQTCDSGAHQQSNFDETVEKFIRDCHRIYRGGSLANKATSLKIAYTQSSGVGDRYFGLGLRIVRELAPEK